MNYIILLENVKGGKAHSRIMKELKTMGNAQQIMPDVYMLYSEESASDIYFQVKNHFDETANLLVIQAGKDWFGFLPVEKLNWLQQNLG